MPRLRGPRRSWSAVGGFRASRSPRAAELRRGPRGGGRDRDGIVDHVAEAELSYARKLGISLGSDLDANRSAIATVLAAASDGSSPVANGWPPRYAARRIAWHVLDHAWRSRTRAEIFGAGPARSDPGQLATSAPGC